MSKTTNKIGRRHFVKQSTIISSGLFLTEPFCKLVDNDFFFVRKDKKNDDESKDVIECLNPRYLLDDYLDEILIQGYDFELNKNNDFKDGGRKVTIFCENLTINGLFQNPGGFVNIICKKLICINDATLSLAGKDAAQNGLEEGPDCDGLHPNGKDANNKDPNDVKYNLDGFTSGDGNIWFASLSGSLDIIAHGGKGGKGEDGGDACDGQDGIDGRDDKSDCYNSRPGSAGGNGIPPGINGKGADGGNGGNGGRIQVFSTISIKTTRNDSATGTFAYDFDLGNSISCKSYSGQGGRGGSGGNRIAKGGAGGVGGTVNKCRESGKDASNCNCKIDGRYPSGIDRSNERSKDGLPGNVGKAGKTGSFSVNPDYESSYSYFSSSFVRLLLLKVEYFYINNEYQKALDTLRWIFEIEAYFEKHAIASTAGGNISAYLKNEPLTHFKQSFILANVYINQLKLGNDFFGNTANYVSLLDSEFINTSISELYPFLSDFEKLAEEICKKGNDEKTFSKLVESQREKNEERIVKLKQNIILETDLMYNLNSEIVSRLNEVSNLQRKINEKESLFKKAVLEATRDPSCSLGNVLKTFATIVAVASGVGAGVGILAAGVSALSDTSKMAGDFLEKIDTIGPWVDPKKWKEVVNSGGEKSIVSQINTIKGQVNDFESNAQEFKKVFLTSKGETKDLVALSFDESDTTLSREKFISQMKDYVDKFPEARAYQNEVLHYIDFCNITNQKRLEYTNRFLQILKDQAQIEQLEQDNSGLSIAKLKTGAKSVDSGTRVLFIDSYLKIKQTFLHLLYLQNKSMDYMTLKPTLFESRLYDFGIIALNETHLISNNRLIDYLNNSTSGKQHNSSIDGTKFTKVEYPISFQQFIDGTISTDGKRKRHIFDFSMEPINDRYLEGEWSEIYITSSKVFIDGLSTQGGSVSFTLKHFGNSLFVTSKGKKVFFSHKPQLRGLTYDLNKKIYKEEFKDVFAEYKLSESKTNPFVGVSPFAHWRIEVDPEVPTNKGLRMGDVTEIVIKFDFYFKPFEI